MMVIIPFRPDIPLTVSSMVAYMGGNGEQLVAGALGSSQPNNKQHLIVFYEKPISALNYVDRSKIAKEDSHLHKFLSDYRLGTRTRFCNTCRRGNDPPDYIVVRM